MTLDRPLQPRLDGRAGAVPQGCLYIDESHSPGWLYIGVLVVPDHEADGLQAHLDRCRTQISYDRELHYSAITTRQKADLACSWLDLAMGPSNPCVRFHILGVDLSRIRQVDFGESAERAENIYRRCLRMALKYVTKAFLPEHTIVRAILHDHRTVATTEYFERHTPSRMRRDGQRVAAESIQLVDSNHAVSGSYRDSNFIQLIDVILGATRDCLDATTQKQHRLRVARYWLPLVQRLTDDAVNRNRNSRYGYVGRCNIGFFPRPADSQDGQVRHASSFYATRRPRLSGRDQLNLFELSD